MSDTRNAELSRQLGLAVVSADYRLAPEHPFPAAVDDAEAVAGWLVDNAAARFGTARLVIGGESAGGYLSAMTLLRLRDRHGTAGRFAGANLVYAGYDLSRSLPSQRGCRTSSTPDLLDPAGLALIGDCFLPGWTAEQRRAPDVSPLYADLHDLPPALLTVGSADHLLDDSLLLAGRWAAAGNHAELAVYPDCPHGFLRMPTELARRAARRIEQFLNRVLEDDR